MKEEHQNDEDLLFEESLGEMTHLDKKVKYLIVVDHLSEELVHQNVEPHLAVVAHLVVMLHSGAEDCQNDVGQQDVVVRLNAVVLDAVGHLYAVARLDVAVHPDVEALLVVEVHPCVVVHLVVAVRPYVGGRLVN